jgi:C4-dicarboxylate-specific signal transduction histidine kinase
MDEGNLKAWQWIVVVITLATPYVILLVNSLIRIRNNHENRQDEFGNELKHELKNLNKTLNTIIVLQEKQKTTCMFTRKTVFKNIEKLEEEINTIKEDIRSSRIEVLKQKEETTKLIEKLKKL